MDDWLRRVVDLADGFKAAMIVLAAAELDLFTALGKGRHSEKEIARKLKTNPRATWLWLNALVALGLLEKRGGRYANAPQARRFLDRSSPGYRGAFLRHISHYWPQWAALTEVVRSGQPKPRGRRDAGSAADFAWAMHDLARERADEVAAILWPQAPIEARRGAPRTALDLGGGPGTYAVAMAKRNPRLTVTVFDDPEILKVTRQVVTRARLTRRVLLQPGDFLEDPVGGSYDLILVSSVIHQYGAAEVRRVLRICAEALAPGGRLAIQDFLLDESMTQPLDAAIFGVHMLVVSSNGRSYSAAEVAQWMRDVGFAKPRLVSVGDGASSLLVAKRAA